MSGRRLSRIGLCSLLGVAACSSDRTAPLTPCTGDSPLLSLPVVGAYVAADPAASAGCVKFAPNTEGFQLEFLLVPQSATGTPGRKSSFWLRGATLPPGAPAPVVAAPAAQPAPAERFHQFLRERERQLYLSTPPAARRYAAPPVALGPPTPPDSGSRRSFSVCADLECKTKTTVGAIAEKIGDHIAIFVDSTKPANGLSDADLSALRDVFDTRLYPLDRTAFGSESDIDSNTVVIVLMTNQVNELVSKSECENTGFVTGYFYGADLIAGQGNNGEIFYSIVADPDPPTLPSCAHSVSQVKRLLPVTFVHEFQHMISFYQHTKLGGNPEVLWLNEALSHFAEERGGRTYLPADSATFCEYVKGDLSNAGQYFSDPVSHYLLATEGIATLTERGAMWLFMRYLVDQTAASTSLADGDVITRQLVQTTFTGAANVEAITRRPFAETVTRWALANYVSDLSVLDFTAPSELQYKSWSFRTDYPMLNASCPKVNGTNGIPSNFPLVLFPEPGSTVDVSNTLRAGSGLYFLAQQGAGPDAFTLLFSDGRGFPLPPAIAARLNVIRLK
jgi:hypothetical protein